MAFVTLSPTKMISLNDVYMQNFRKRQTNHLISIVAYNITHILKTRL